MLDQSQRTAILELAQAGHSVRTIAHALCVSREAVDAVLESGSVDVPRIVRAELGEKWRDEIVAQYSACKGNLVRVHEELVKQGATLSYPALTGFCRRHGIGHEPKKPAGRYEFKPGEEMQHDTSPCKAPIGGVLRAVQIAALVLCYSRLIFIQGYSAFRRFECKLFLTAALRYFGCTAGRCMIDNTHVVVLKGTGATMVPVPEMAAFGERMGFVFAAHEKGDANRSARVEGPFDYVQNNFLVGRDFEGWRHFNHEAVLWCDGVNATFSPKLHASRRELFAAERPSLKELPIWVPEVYMLHQRIVDIEGNITVHTNRYSVPYPLIGRRVEVRELEQRIEVYDGPRLVASHARVEEARAAWVTDPAHRPRRGERPARSVPVEEQELLLAQPALRTYVTALKKHASGRGTLAFRRLLKMVRDYPEEPLLCAVSRAEQYGLYDLDRLERMVLKQIATDYFVLPVEDNDGDKEPEDE
jgi:transposase